ncbi:SCO3374 family protein [Streptomyces sp. NPDC017979]|uniref:SCO3374 family protein n=1 Tax=Streptomyces sp. NPDC017979 TaxID=3365024 RepID=UPI0037919287
MTIALPFPRKPPEARVATTAAVARWYATGLGWAVAELPPPLRTAPAPPAAPCVDLLTGLRFDVLDVPADAGAAVLRQAGPTGPLGPLGPVALHGSRMRLLVAAGSADEVPGLLQWLEWGGVTLDLRAVGAGGRTAAPVPPGWSGAQGVAVWLRPPVPGREVEPTLPALAPFGRGAAADGDPGSVRGPDLVRLLDTLATECHRARLLRANARAAPGGAYEYAAGEYPSD